MAFIRPFLPHILVVAALGFLIWWIGERGEQRAEDRISKALAKQREQFQQDLRASEGRLSSVITANDRDLADKLGAFRIYHQTVIKPTVEKEIASDPRLSDPAFRMSDSLLRAINAARTGSSCSRRADGGIECTLPATVAAP